MPNINLSNELYTQLGALVVGFNDTPEVVIERLIQENERLSQERLSQERLSQESKTSPTPEENKPIPEPKKTRRKITFEDVKTLYPLAKDIADGKKNTYNPMSYRGMKMNRGSARMHIIAFLALRHGGDYKGSISQRATRYFLEKIRTDNGDHALRIALQVLSKHITYRKKFRDKGKGLQAIHAEFATQL